MFSQTNPVAVELYVLIGTSFYTCTNVANVVLIGIIIWALWKTPLNSTSSADAKKFCGSFHLTNISPFPKNISLVCDLVVR